MLFNPTINQEVTRTKGDYSVYGKRGKIVELDQEAGRARVFWYGDKRTWVKYDALSPSEEITQANINRYKFDATVRDIKKWGGHRVAEQIEEARVKYGITDRVITR